MRDCGVFIDVALINQHSRTVSGVADAHDKRADVPVAGEEDVRPGRCGSGLQCYQGVIPRAEAR